MGQSGCLSFRQPRSQKGTGGRDDGVPVGSGSRNESGQTRPGMVLGESDFKEMGKGKARHKKQEIMWLRS